MLFVSLFAFVCEKVFRMLMPIKESRKVKFQKVVPITLTDDVLNMAKLRLNAGLIKTFRVKSLCAENIDKFDEFLEDKISIQKTTGFDYNYISDVMKAKSVK
ncbi:hypothetical protein ACKWTF_001558 [Chironomus riparius]